MTTLTSMVASGRSAATRSCSRIATHWPLTAEGHSEFGFKQVKILREQKE